VCWNGRERGFYLIARAFRASGATVTGARHAHLARYTSVARRPL